MDPRQVQDDLSRRVLQQNERRQYEHLFSLNDYKKRVYETRSEIGRDGSHLREVCRELRARNHLTISGSDELEFFNRKVQPYHGTVTHDQ